MILNLEKANSIVEKTSEILGVDVTSMDRSKRLSDARKMFCAYIYTNSRFTLEEISEVVKKSRSSVFYYIEQHEKNMCDDKGYADTFNHYTQSIQESAKIQ